MTEGSNWSLQKCKLTCKHLSATRQFPALEMSTLNDVISPSIQGEDMVLSALELKSIRVIKFQCQIWLYRCDLLNPNVCRKNGRQSFFWFTFIPLLLIFFFSKSMSEVSEIFRWRLSFVFCEYITYEFLAPASEIQIKVQKCFVFFLTWLTEVLLHLRITLDTNFHGNLAKHCYII